VTQLGPQSHSGRSEGTLDPDVSVVGVRGRLDRVVHARTAGTCAVLWAFACGASEQHGDLALPYTDAGDKEETANGVTGGDSFDQFAASDTFTSASDASRTNDAPFAMVSGEGGVPATACSGAAAGGTSPPASIDATGKIDVTAEMQAFLDGAADGMHIQFDRAARYRIEGTLALKHRTGLVLDGRGTQFFATTPGDRTRSQFDILDSNSITVCGLVLHGANPSAGTGPDAYVAALEAQHGFNVVGSQHVTIDGVTVTDVYGDFVYFGGGSRFGTVVNSHLQRNGRQGISVTNGQDILIQMNTISDTRRATFDIEPNVAGDVIQRVRAVDNQIGAGRLNLLSSAGAAATIADISLERNHVMRTFAVDIATPGGSRRGRYAFTDNVATEPLGTPQGAAILVSRVDGLVVTGNTIPLQNGRNMAMVSVIESCSVLVSGNTFPGGTMELRTDGYVGCM